MIHIIYDMVIEGQEIDSFFTQGLTWLAVLGLGYFGAKHRDTDSASQACADVLASGSLSTFLDAE